MLEGDVLYNGMITFELKTDVKINWPGLASLVLPITVTIRVSQLKGKARLLYSLSRQSYLQLMQTPQVKVDIEPVIGDSCKIDLHLLPFVN